MIDDQALFEQFHAAYDAEPGAGGFERLRSVLVDSRVRIRRQSTCRVDRTTRQSVRLLAAIAVFLLALAATGAFFAINRYAHQSVPAVRHATACTAAQLLVDQSMVCTANDAAVIVNTHGGFADPQAPLTVFITHDAGRTWTSLETPCCLGDAPSPTLRWVDSENLVVAYGNDLIEVTGDGGSHWQAIKSTLADGGSSAPFFLNAHEGWQYGAHGLYHTADAGRHWTLLSTAAPFDAGGGWFARLFFMNADDGFFTSLGSAPGSEALSITRDGGRSWSRAALPPSSGTVAQGPFMFGQRGLVYSTRDGLDGLVTMTVSTTSDGGLTWSPHSSVSGVALAALDAETWWVVDAEGRLSQTTDGGHSWQRIRTDLAARYYGMGLVSVTPVGNGVLWGSGADGYATVRSTDGGAHWSIVRTPVE